MWNKKRVAEVGRGWLHFPQPAALKPQASSFWIYLTNLNCSPSPRTVFLPFSLLKWASVRITEILVRPFVEHRGPTYRKIYPISFAHLSLFYIKNMSFEKFRYTIHFHFTFLRSGAMCVFSGMGNNRERTEAPLITPPPSLPPHPRLRIPLHMIYTATFYSGSNIFFSRG